MSFENIKLPPHDVNLEKAVLCCYLFNDYNFGRAQLIESDFYVNDHKKIYRTIKALHDKRIRVDVVSMTAECNELDEQYLFDITTHVLTDAGMDSYETTIKEFSLYRNLIEGSKKLVSICYDRQGTREALESLSAMGANAIHSNNKGTVGYDILCDIIERMGTQEENICKYGYKKMDEHFHGYKSGNVIVIGARPGVGKTVFAINLLYEVAKQGKKTALFSLEMNKEEIGKRIISKISKVSTYEIANESKKDAICNSIADSYEITKNIQIYDTYSRFDMICNEIRRKKHAEGLDVVAIDYLQLMRGDSKQTKNDEIGAITAAIKQLAQELEIAVILPAQLNRQGDDSPELRHLRDSGNIEQDADIVMLLERNTDTTIGVIVAKNRSGKTGYISLGINYETMNIYHIDSKD